MTDKPKVFSFPKPPQPGWADRVLYALMPWPTLSTGDDDGRHRRADQTVYFGADKAAGDSAGADAAQGADSADQDTAAQDDAAKDAGESLTIPAGPWVDVSAGNIDITVGAHYGGRIIGDFQHNLRAMPPRWVAVHRQVVNFDSHQNSVWVTSRLRPGAPPLPKHEGIEVGDLIAWRCWRVVDLRDDDTGEIRHGLQSMWVDHLWGPGEIMHGDIAAPVDGFSSTHAQGIHAFKSGFKAYCEYMRAEHFARPHDYWAGRWVSDDPTPRVLGKVQLWGEIVEHENGYRAEHAKIVKLVLIEPNSRDSPLNHILEALGKAYDVPIGED